MNGTGEIEPALAEFIRLYMQAMCAPGMTVALVQADGRSSTAGFGLSDVESRQPVTPEMLFQIGSISKSFCALILLRMHDEGKLDLHAPILELLPWVPLDMPFGAITAHHLLTHSFGIPGGDRLFFAGPQSANPAGVFAGEAVLVQQSGLQPSGLSGLRR